MRLDNVRIVGDNVRTHVGQPELVADLLVLLIHVEEGGLLGDDPEERLHPAGAGQDHLPIQSGATLSNLTVG